MSRLLWIMLALVAAALVAAGCGGSDKPAYCSDVSDLRAVGGRPQGRQA